MSTWGGSSKRWERHAERGSVAQGIAGQSSTVLLRTIVMRIDAPRLGLLSTDSTTVVFRRVGGPKDMGSNPGRLSAKAA